MWIHPRNRAEFDYLGITAWQEAGYTGNGVSVAVLDGFGKSNNYHGEHVRAIGHAIAPECCITTYDGLQVNKVDKGTVLLNASMEGNLIINTGLSYLNDYGVTIICGAGNNGAEGESNLAQKPFTIAVSAMYYIDATDQIRLKSYSSFGKNAVDVASFTDIYVNNIKFTGTSCATPMVTFMLALWCEYFYDQNFRYPTQEEIKTFVHSNCEDVLDEGNDMCTGYGMFRLPCPPVPKKKRNDDILMFVGRKDYYVGGVQKTFIEAPMIHNGKTMVELRSICETLRKRVDYTALPPTEEGEIQGIIEAY